DERSQHKNYDRALRILRSRLYEMQQQKLHKERAEQRRTLIGSGDRSERIRTYNFPQNRVTDHRINLNLYKLDAIIAGELEELVPEDARQRFRTLVRRRVEGCPVAYLVGRKEFFSLPFEITPAVLIPRPETEFVVMECLRLARQMAEPRVLDIGTGSGNIAVSVAHQQSGAKVTAVDRTADILAVAARNAAKHGVAGSIRFLQGDLFSPLASGEQFDFILSNPP